MIESRTNTLMVVFKSLKSLTARSVAWYKGKATSTVIFLDFRLGILNLVTKILPPPLRFAILKHAGFEYWMAHPAKSDFILFGSRIQGRRLICACRELAEQRAAASLLEVRPFSARPIRSLTLPTPIGFD